MFRRRYKKNGGYIGDWNLQNNTGVLAPLQEYSRHSRVPDWYRPVDWLPMPDMPEGTQMFAGLMAVFKGASGFSGSSGDSNFVALLARGNYVVDWGNGFTSAHTDNTVAQYQYNFEGVSASTETTLGYRQVIIKVTPQTGATLTAINLNQRFSSAPVTPSGFNSWLSIKLSGRNVNSFGIGSSSPTGRIDLLEEFEVVGDTVISGIADIFQQVSLVQCMKGTRWTRNVLSSNSAFTNARSLRKIPLLDTRGFVNNTHSMFNQCSTFELCPPLYFDGVNDSSVINTAGLFNSSGIVIAPYLSLRRLNPSSIVTNGAAGMFSFCQYLKKIPENLDFSKNRFFNSMFQGCVSLSKIPKINTENGVTFNNMFDQCYSIDNLPGICMGKAGDIRNVFDETGRLKTIGVDSIGFGVTSGSIAATDAFFRNTAIKAPSINWERLQLAGRIFGESRISIIPGGGITSGGGTGATFGWNTNSFLYQALALKSFPVLNGLLQNIDMRFLNASPTMLNQIFEGLGTTAVRLNVNGNWGATTGRGVSFGIATAKGWTFTNV
jgi:hypothetical protein